MENGYEIDQFSIADQFPHTHHIETIFALNKGQDDVSLQTQWKIKKSY